MGDNNKIDNDGCTPLQQLILKGDDISQYIDSSDDIAINHRNKFGQTALHLAVTLTPFNLANLKALLNYDDINVNIADQEGDTPLSSAVAYNNYAAVEELIKRDEIDINQQFYDGNTVLHMALSYDSDYADIANLIIDSRSDIDYNLKNNDGKTIRDLQIDIQNNNGNNDLQQAIIDEKNPEDIISLISGQDADYLNQKNSKDKTALQLLITCNFSYEVFFEFANCEGIDASSLGDLNVSYAQLFYAFQGAHRLASLYNDMDKEQDSSIFSFFKDDPIKSLKIEAVKIAKDLCSLQNAEFNSQFYNLCVSADGILRELIDHCRRSEKAETATRKEIEPLFKVIPKSGCALR